MSGLLLAAVLSSAIAAAISALVGRGRGRADRAAAVALAGSTVAALLSVAALAIALAAGTDAVGALLAVLVTALTAVVQSFARRHLRGDPRTVAFAAASSAFAAAGVLTAAASDLVVFAGAWTAGSITVVALLATAGGLPQTRLAVRRAALAFAVGDLALWAGVLVALQAVGGTAFADLGRADAATAALVGALVAVAAISRAGALPLHRWLPATVASSTPVSALLHAGFVNAGALLLLRFDTLPSVAAALVAGLAGGATVVVAGAAMLTRPDVKGRLVQSTAAQMGFMLLACALGAYGVAFFHVVGHAMFKAALFLGAGSAVERAVRARAARPDVARPVARWLAPLGVVLVLGAAAAASGALVQPSAVLLCFVAAALVLAAHRVAVVDAPAWWRGAALAGLAAVGGGYALAVAAFGSALGIAPAAETLPPAVALVVFAAVVAVAIALRGRGRLADRLYVAALAWGRPPLPTPRPVPSVGGAPVADSSASVRVSPVHVSPVPAEYRSAR